MKARLMVPVAAAEAKKANVEETNRLNLERRASSASDRKELADIEKKTAAMIAVFDELTERLAAVPDDIPDIHPNIEDICRLKVERGVENTVDICADASFVEAVARAYEAGFALDFRGLVAGKKRRRVTFSG